MTCCPSRPVPGIDPNPPRLFWRRLTRPVVINRVGFIVCRVGIRSSIRCTCRRAANYGTGRWGGLWEPMKVWFAKTANLRIRDKRTDAPAAGDR